MINVLHSGFYSTIQDLGREDYQSFGVPISGAMDHYASKMANAILGNDKNCAVLEITMLGPKLDFTCDTIIAVTGAEMPPKLNGIEVDAFKAINVKKGDILSFGKLNTGFRSYLAVSGGFQDEKILNSRSMYKGITQTYMLKKGDVLEILPRKHAAKKYSSIKYNDKGIQNQYIEVFKGPEFDRLNEEQIDVLLNQEFLISKENNRMAYQLENLIVNSLDQIITSLVLPGTVQLTPSGRLIVLMRDCQTTGGYPRVLQLSESSINLLSQKKVGDKFKFKLKAYNQ